MDNFKDEKIQELSVTTMIFKTKNMVFKKNRLFIQSTVLYVMQLQCSIHTGTPLAAE